MGKINEAFLEKYLNSNAPSGHEMEMGGQKVWIDYISEYVDYVNTDIYGTAYAVIENINSDFKVVIEAHADEIAWCVKYIRDDGFIRVERIGGSDVLITPSKRVFLWTKYGKITGVFGFPPIHDNARKTTIDNESIFLDIGVSSKKEVLDKGVEIGTVITFQDEFERLGDNFYVGRALDNRIGGFAIAEVARKLKEKSITLPYNLYIVNSVQEEVGLYGARMIASTIKPDIAIITDVCHATDSPAYNVERQGDFKAGFGGVISRSSAVHNNLLSLIRSVADKEKIPYQLAVSSRGTSTDTDAFAYSNSGIPSALISFPLRYMHTTNETVHKKDVKNVIKLIYHTLLNIEDNHNLSYEF